MTEYIAECYDTIFVIIIYWGARFFLKFPRPKYVFIILSTGKYLGNNFLFLLLVTIERFLQIHFIFASPHELYVHILALLSPDTQREPPRNGKIAELGISFIIGIAIAASLGLLILIVCTLCIIYHALCAKILCPNHHSNEQQGKDAEVVAPPIFRSSSRVGEVSINDRSRARDAWM